MPVEKFLTLAPEVKLDASLATQIIAALARRGAGKTYLAGRLVEFLASIGCPVIVLDTVGNWWGLTLAANGKDPGLPFLILGGSHGALDLPPTGGAAVARLIVEKSLSVVLDVSRMRKSDMLTFVAEFAEAFFELIVKHPAVRHFVCEEMQRVAPQTMAGTQQTRTYRAFEDLIRLGRNYGLGFTMLSQRPQSINKELLSQVEVLFAGQMVEAHGRKALDEWVVQHDVKLKTMFAEIASLQQGEFFLWSPSWLKLFKKIKVPPKWTYDASSTPSIGSQTISLGVKMAGVTQEQLAEIRKMLSTEPEPDNRVDDSGPYYSDELEEANRRAEALQEQLETLIVKFDETRERLKDLLEYIDSTKSHPPEEPVEAEELPEEAVPVRPNGQGFSIREMMKPPPPPRSRQTNGKSTEGLGKCARAIMTVLLQAQKPLDKKRLARRAVYSAGTGGFNNALGELRRLGWITGSPELHATSEGKKGYEAAYGRVPPLPTGKQLFDFWMQHPSMGAAERAILTVLRNHRGKLAKDEVAKRTVSTKGEPYQAGTGGFNNALGNLRTLGLIEGRPEMSIAPELR